MNRLKPYVAQIKSNLVLMGRDRTVLFFSYLFPLSLFFMFAQLMGGGKSPGAMVQVIAMVLVLGILSNGLFGAGMRTVQDRETNVLRRFKVTPITAMPVMVASVVAGVVNFVPMVVFLFVLSSAVYHMPVPHNLLAICLFVIVGAFTFRSIGMIVASVVNTAQEAQILIQLLYLPMLFLSGATFPITIMPDWLQAVAQFLPATYLYQGITAIMVGGETIGRNWIAVGALLLSTAVSLFIGSKLFRWEKEEKIPARSKLWILAALAPFFVVGVYQAQTRENMRQMKMLTHVEARNRSILFNNVHVFLGDGRIIQHGAVLIRAGKIEQVFDTPPADTSHLDATVWDESGRTLMPGMIDMHVHIGAPGGVYKDRGKYADPNLTSRRLAAYLYCGITAVRSTGDWLHQALDLRARINRGDYMGAELFADGPLFTAPGGHPTEMLKYIPAAARSQAEREFVRLPDSPGQARSEVDELKTAGVDGIKAVLDTGGGPFEAFHRMQGDIYSAVVAEAKKDGLPVATHTGSVQDVEDAIAAGTNTVEHGSREAAIPAAVWANMAQHGIAYDPTLSVYKAITDLAHGNMESLDGSLLQRVAPPNLINDTRSVLTPAKHGNARAFDGMFSVQNANLLAAYQAHVPLITGTDAGNMLVIHGPTVQNEVELWVKAGVPAAAALQAATYNAAKHLRADNRIGLIAKGREATLVLLDGDPVQDITATERISEVFFRGEQVRRWDVLDQDKK